MFTPRNFSFQGVAWPSSSCHARPNFLVWMCLEKIYNFCTKKLFKILADIAQIWNVRDAFRILWLPENATSIDFLGNRSTCMETTQHNEQLLFIMVDQNQSKTYWNRVMYLWKLFFWPGELPCSYVFLNFLDDFGLVFCYTSSWRVLGMTRVCCEFFRILEGLSISLYFMLVFTHNATFLQTLSPTCLHEIPT